MRVCLLQCLPFAFSFPPARVCPFLFLLSIFFLSRLYLFVSLLASSVLRFLLFCYLPLFSGVASSTFLGLGLLVSFFFCFRGVLSGGVRMLVVVFCLCSTPLAKRASLKSSNICSFSCVNVLFRFLNSSFRRRVVTFTLSIFLGSMWSTRFLWRLVQCTACIRYVRARTSFFHVLSEV